MVAFRATYYSKLFRRNVIKQLEVDLCCISTREETWKALQWLVRITRPCFGTWLTGVCGCERIVLLLIIDSIGKGNGISRKCGGRFSWYALYMAYVYWSTDRNNNIIDRFLDGIYTLKQLFVCYFDSKSPIRVGKVLSSKPRDEMEKRSKFFELLYSNLTSVLLVVNSGSWSILIWVRGDE